LRDAMVDRLKDGVFRDARIEAAFRKVPRHLFLPGTDVERVYGGEAIPIRWDEQKRPISSSSEVAIMAMMAEQLELAEGMRVLEIGAGTGYNAAILSELVGPSGQVVTIDIDPEISAEARAHLGATGHGAVEVRTGDGWDGVADGAPYDRIVLAASTADLSPSWIDQLSEGGILVVPLWIRAGWQAVVALRKAAGRLVSTDVRGGGFIALRGRAAPPDVSASRGGWRIVGAAEEDRDAIFALLETEPRIVLGPEYDAARGRSWDRMTALVLATPLIGVTGSGKGFGHALYDRASGHLAVATFGHVGYLGSRIVYALYGGEGALMAHQDAVEQAPTSCADLEVEAEPLSSPNVDGGIRREHYRPRVRRRILSAAAT
jgi:protein-L-isoaspartate(D-aspartate) O-methyltransferase